MSSTTYVNPCLNQNHHLYKLLNKICKIHSFKKWNSLKSAENHISFTKLNSLVVYIMVLNWADKIISLKIHGYRVKTLDILKNEILKKQTSNTKFCCVKN